MKLKLLSLLGVAALALLPSLRAQTLTTQLSAGAGTDNPAATTVQATPTSSGAPTLGCSYAAWIAYMETLGCETTGRGKAGVTLFTWTLEYGQTISCEFKHGVAVGVTIELPPPTHWTAMDLASLMINLTGTSDADWSDPVRADSFYNLKTKDGKFRAKMNDNLIFVGYAAE